jgi:hypothetical protein
MRGAGTWIMEGYQVFVIPPIMDDIRLKIILSG